MINFEPDKNNTNQKTNKGFIMGNSVTFSSIKDELNTGDIILFHGPSAESKLIEKLDKSPFSHVGIVVRLEETDHNRPLLWESSTIQDLIDFETDQARSGVHLVDLEGVLKYCMSKPAKDGKTYQFAWRKLNPGTTKNGMDNFVKFMGEVDGRAFPSLSEMAIHFAEGHYDIKTDNRTYFCSQLASDTFMHLNLLTDNHPDNYYSPGSFSEDHFGLEMLNGAQLIGEQYFELD